jgi:hypothetical protein
MSLSFSSWDVLYQYPQMGQYNFIKDILDHGNVVLVMQLQSGPVMGAFTEVSFSSKPVYIPKDNPRCFLFNLALDHFLFASRTNKTHSRDENYITFGSWEIKMKAGELCFESEMGTQGGCFGRKEFNGREAEDSKAWLFGEGVKASRFLIEKIGIYALK